MKELSDAEALEKTLTDELQKYLENDPELLDAKRRAALEAKQAANRFTGVFFPSL